ncbi:MAG TPA: hypothetical protein VFB03_00050 [Candidatus Saccharimonadales bacterium]|nr:hypothetical protein [Candidatus Saccharimonadales bacterium]
MILLKEEPSITDLHYLIDQVPRYPIAVYELVDLAKDTHSPQPVIDFYSSFPDDMKFADQFELLERTEEVEMLRHESSPKEEMHAPEED